MSHPYDKGANCQCTRCTKERARRFMQAPVKAQGPAERKRGLRRNASKAEQHARYIDCGPGAWDDRE